MACSSRVLAGAIGAAALLLGAAPGLAAPVTYTFQSPNFTTRLNYSQCAIGPCTTYVPSDHITGTVTFDSPPPANLSGDYGLHIVDYSVSDGHTTIAFSNPLSRIYSATVQTDGAGVLTDFSFQFDLRRAGYAAVTTPSTDPAARTDTIRSASTGAAAFANGYCTSMAGGNSAASSPGVCTSLSIDGSSSVALGPQIGTPVLATTPPAPVPTLGTWTLAALTAVLLGFGVAGRRRLAFPSVKASSHA